MIDYPRSLDPRCSSTSYLMIAIESYQERGATLREIANALKVPLEEIHREIMDWLDLKKKGRAA